MIGSIPSPLHRTRRPRRRLAALAAGAAVLAAAGRPITDPDEAS